MTQSNKKTHTEDYVNIHEQYMNILNAVPDIIYWIDNYTALKGCNHSFIKWIGIQEPRELKGTPYEQMAKLTSWPKHRIEAFRLDDMNVLFSGKATFDIKEAPIENCDGKTMYFRSRRLPMSDEMNNVVGLVVILTQITESEYHQEQRDCQHSNMHCNAPLTTQEDPHVLMVEDNFIAQQVEEALLTELHCLVDIAESGDKALKLFGPGKYDIVFMDIGLEDTSGYMVAKKIRQMEENTNFHVPIIALTSFQADVVKYDCNDYFMDGVLTKPLTRAQAKQIIDYFIHHKNISITGLKSVK